MKIEVRYSCEGVRWEEVAETLKDVGMAHFEPERHRRAFEASRVTVFLWEEGRLVGFGRALSDGAYQAAVYDCAVVPGRQGRGLGRLLVESLLSKVPDCNVILYAAVGKESFYEALGFRRMKTGMARFRNVALMREKGYTD